LHQADGEAVAGGLVRDDRWRKLAVVAGEDDAAGAEQRNPAGGFDRLRRFVDDDEIERAVANDLAIDTGEGGTENGSRIEQMLGHLRLNPAGVGDQLA